MPSGWPGASLPAPTWTKPCKRRPGQGAASSPSPSISWPDVGIAIQAYLRDCAQDLVGLADWARRRGTPVWVRLIKGAYWDYETVLAAQEGWPVPVFEHKWDTDDHYERLTLFLLDLHE